MSQVLLSPLPPMCAAMGQTEFPRRLLPIPADASVRPLNVGLLNLMPTKEVTERQWLRLLLKAEYPKPLKLHLLKLASWQPTHVKPLHMARYYTTIESALATNQLDMLIITGAPLGRIDYAAVGYWPELTALMCELEVRAIPTLFSCWAAQAALHHLYQVPTLRRDTKLSGVFPQQVAEHPYPESRTQRLIDALSDHNQVVLSGASDPSEVSPLSMPQSRFALPDPDVLQQRLLPCPQGLHAVLRGQDTGVSVLRDDSKGRLFLLGHPEYEHDTLAVEYSRDLAQDPATKAPLYYQIPAVNRGGALRTRTQCSKSQAAALQSANWQALGAVLLRHWLDNDQPLLRPHRRLSV